MAIGYAEVEIHTKMEKRFVLSSFVIKFYIICMVIAVNGLSISIAVTANTSPSNRMSDSNATITFLRVATTLVSDFDVI